MIPGEDWLSIQTSSQSADTFWHGSTGPSAFGTGTNDIPASSATGDPFTLQFAEVPVFDLPTTYVSGTQITGSLTFDSTTLAALGLTPGASYDFTWESNAHADSLEINIEPTSQSVPEPVSLAMFAAGLTTLGLIRRRRTR
jgi:hypothetical protein